jgi:hypothetical protein
MTDPDDFTPKGFVAGCLIGLAAALLLVGVVSGTLLRHVVQILPIALAFVVVRRRPAWGAYAALPIFLFWIMIVVLIWLFLLGLSRIASGDYTVIEIVLTLVMAACSVAGLVKSVALGRSTSLGNRVAAFVLFAALQVVAMWVSLLRPIASR